MLNAREGLELETALASREQRHPREVVRRKKNRNLPCPDVHIFRLGSCLHFFQSYESWVTGPLSLPS